MLINRINTQGRGQTTDSMANLINSSNNSSNSIDQIRDNILGILDISQLLEATTIPMNTGKGNKLNRVGILDCMVPTNEETAHQSQKRIVNNNRSKS